jgi:hypothetical protein
VIVKYKADRQRPCVMCYTVDGPSYRNDDLPLRKEMQISDEVKAVLEV